MRQGLAVVCAILAIVGVILLAKAQGDTIRDLEKANQRLTDELTAERASTKALRENVAKATQRAQRAQKELDHALSQVPEWRDAAVPEPVADSLCRTLRCAKPNPVRTPGG